MKTYLDTSALVKRVVREPDSDALARYLAEIPADTLFTSALARTELIRAVGRVDAGAISKARHLLAGLDIIHLTRALLGAAGELQPVHLRSLDAIHLAAAQRAGASLRVVITYDIRMSDAARALGIPVDAPRRE